MRMIDRIIRSMQDTGLIDGMSLEDADTLATAALEAMKEPNGGMLVDGVIADSIALPSMSEAQPAHIMRIKYTAMIDAALNE